MPFVTITTLHRGRLVDRRDVLCERHARPFAERLGARWPLPHEHAAETRKTDRTTYEVRVSQGEAPCDFCEHDDTATETLAEA